MGCGLWNSQVPSGPGLAKTETPVLSTPSPVVLNQEQLCFLGHRTMSGTFGVDTTWGEDCYWHPSEERSGVLLNIQQCIGPPPPTHTPIKNYPVPMLVEKKLPRPSHARYPSSNLSALRRHHQRNNLMCPLVPSKGGAASWLREGRHNMRGEKRWEDSTQELVRDGAGASNRPTSGVWQRA